jgi:uncharacterized membrane protein
LAQTFLLKTLKENSLLIVLLLVFGAAFCLISLPNHYNFRTYALDLGMFNNAVFDFSQFRNNVFTLGVMDRDLNYFYDHFSPITVLLAPFRFLGTSGLLIAQILAILLGGLGVFKYAKLRSTSSWLPYLAIIYFFLHWGVANALSFDFHTNVIAAMIVPWLFVAFHQKKWKLFFLMIGLLLICKENIGLWLFFILIGIMLQTWKKTSTRLKIGLVLLAGFSLIYFFVITSMVMPSLGPGAKQLFRYSHIGDSYSEIIINLISNPLDSLKYLYENTSTNHVFDFTKNEFHLMTLFAGGLAVIFRPSYAIMLIPLYAQKFLSSQISLWGIDSHYSIEFVPIMTLALVDCFKSVQFKRVSLALFTIVILITGYTNVLKMGKRANSWYQTKNINIFSSKHYSSEYDIEKIHDVIDKIKDHSEVLSVSNSLSPHLAFRDKLYMYPRLGDAKKVVLLRPIQKEDNSYPLNFGKFPKHLEMMQAKGWVITMDDGQIIILEKF